MKVLLDTHAFLWFVLGDPRLSTAATALIGDGANEVLVSPASYWEVAIKVSLGKYTLNAPFEQFWKTGIGANGFSRAADRGRACRDGFVFAFPPSRPI